MSKTIPLILFESVKRFKDHIAFNYYDGEWTGVTYQEFYNLSRSISSFLLKLSINKGDRVCIISENRPEWCASYLGVVMVGGIAVPVDIQLSYEEIRNILIDSEPKAVFYSNKTEENFLKAAMDLDIKGINLDKSSFPIPSYEPLIDLSGEDIASIIYTSGTTGKPKGVMLSHANFCSDADAIIATNIVSQRDNVLSLLPLHHTYPFMCNFLVPLLLGASITFSPGLKVADILSSIREKEVTIAVFVPRMLEIIRDRLFSEIRKKGFIGKGILILASISGLLRRKMDINIGKFLFSFIHKNFGPLRLFVSGGARLEETVMTDLESIGFTIVEGYGLTETSPVLTFNPLRKRKPGSAGKPLSNVELRIGEDSEIIVRGPMIMKGYYKNQAATMEAIRDGWLYTGDTGYLDEDGYLFITGRKKEVIVLSSGKNIYPEDVERIYERIPLIKEICIVEKDGYLHAVIVPDLDYAKRAMIGNIYDSLTWSINSVAMNIPEYMRIKGFTLYQNPLPRTPLGKLRRFMVKEILKEGRLEEKAEEPIVLDEFSKRVLDCIRMQLKENVPVNIKDNLELDLKFDSLMRLELLSALETSFSVSLPETFIVEVQTVEDVIAKMKEYELGKAVKGERLSFKDFLRREPSETDREKVLLNYRWWQEAIVYILFILQKTFFKVFFRLKVVGDLNIPQRGPIIIAANHTSYLDGFVIAAALPFNTFKNTYFLGYQKYFVGTFKSIFARLAHVIPIDPDVYLNRALQISSYVLQKDKLLCIFPEGGRSFNGKLLPFKKGIGVLSLELNVPVLPVIIKGTFEALPRGAKFIRPSKVRVSFGKPIYPLDIDMKKRPLNVDEYQFFADELRRIFEVSSR
jgi:long-chain acyl-CoA synthetase